MRDLLVRILIRTLFGALGYQDFRGHRARGWFVGTWIVFREAREVRLGACHHQKLLVIDDRLAPCGRGDIVTNRWDSPHHHARPILAGRLPHTPHHEITVLVEGAAAAALGELLGA